MPDNLRIEIVKGDIANQKGIEVVVNAANARLKPGGGVAGAIHQAAGPGLEKECRPLAPINPGEAVITGGHNLPNEYVIHCLGPVYGKEQPEDELLASCYRNALNIADDNEIASIAFPAISTGIFGYPSEEAAKISLNTVIKVAGELTHLQLVRFVLFSEEDYGLYNRLLRDA